MWGLWRASNGQMSPDAIDNLEIWQIAVLLGHSTELESGDESKGGGRVGQQREAFHAAAKERNRQRLAHAKGQGPAPQAAPVSQAAFSQLAGALSGHS